MGAYSVSLAPADRSALFAGGPNEGKADACETCQPQKAEGALMVFVELHDGPLDAVVRQIGKLDRRYDIPYLAGYSRNGKTI